MAWTKAQIKELVREAAAKYGIDEAIALAQINQESSFNPNAGSSAGAVGVAQFMPATAQRFGLKDRRDPVSSLEAWGKYMTFLLKKFNGNYRSALAGYNAGEGAVQSYLTGIPLKTKDKTINASGIKTRDGVPPYKETQDYVARILKNAGAGDAGTSDLTAPSTLPVATRNSLIFVISAVVLLAFISGNEQRRG